MTKKDIEKIIVDEAGEIEFKFNNKNSGIDSYLVNDKHVFFLWYGDKEKEFDSLEELLKYPMFDNLNALDVLLNS